MDEHCCLSSTISLDAYRKSYELTVSPDKLKAFLQVKNDEGVTLSVDEIRTFLAEHGICSGLMDEKIEKHLRTKAIYRQPCVVAEGTPAIPGNDAQINYHFDTDPLKIGEIKSGGTVDFKAKGKIPQVKAGMLLAEKVPLVQAKSGNDIFGNRIQIDAAKERSVFCGPGTRAEGLKIYAQRDGRPVLWVDGRVAVLSELTIEGDVGLETGHIDFAGFVNVTGAVRPGFRVKAGRLEAREIHGAELDIAGDIVVSEGITGTKVACGGNIRSFFIHSSQFTAKGDVIVEGEVIDSRIETKGALLAAPLGKIFGSYISARKGATAAQIGSESSKPCCLAIGEDADTPGAIHAIKEEISMRMKEKERTLNAIESLTQTSFRVKEEMMKWVQIQDLATREKRACLKTIAESKGGNDKEKMAQLQEDLKRIREKIKSADGPLQKLMDQEDTVAAQISDLKLQAQELDGAAQALEYETEILVADSISTTIPTVKVSGLIFSGTTVKGCHSSVVLNENIPSLLIREINVPLRAPQQQKITEWKMEMSPL